jgi:hypothetical protein
MAELYNVGTNRISYRARKFAPGKVVTGYIWTPALVQSSLLTFAEIGEGLYYLDYDFADEGTYIGKFYEDGVPSTTGVFRVSDIVTLINTVKTAQGGGLTIE